MSEATILILACLSVFFVMFLIDAFSDKCVRRPFNDEPDRLRKDLLEILKRYIELEERRAAKEQPLWKVPASTIESDLEKEKK